MDLLVDYGLAVARAVLPMAQQLVQLVATQDYVFVYVSYLECPQVAAILGHLPHRQAFPLQECHREGWVRRRGTIFVAEDVDEGSVKAEVLLGEDGVAELCDRGLVVEGVVFWEGGGSDIDLQQVLLSRPPNRGH